MPDPRPFKAAPETPARSAGFRGARLLIAAALGLGILEAAQGRFFYRDIPDAAYWPEALARTLPSWVALMLLVPAVFAFAHAVRFDRRRAIVAIPAYIGAGGLFVLLHLGTTAVFEAARHPGDRPVEYYIRYFLMRHAVSDFLLFCGVAGAAHFARHQEALRARERAETELRAGLAEARLRALRSQLNPHFLFNALNAVHALALTGDREQLITTIRALSDLLRIVLDETPGDLGTVESEMRFLDRYFEIQQVRFGARLRIERDIPDEVLGARVPSLVLQPLVENAIEHGLGRRAGPGHVAIRARRMGEVLELRVEDSGPGFSAASTRAGGSGLGLDNTRRRLEHLYGAAASLACDDVPGGGARVTVRLPWTNTVTPATAAPDTQSREPVPTPAASHAARA